ncbi:hypothetical protein [Solimonas soli]|uniref:hypothetical protein n=1 Tax=Solimonas soli TaxID=413479 RepID=UPI0004894CD8|nr:hypothetical protein [Solimonas soli]
MRKFLPLVLALSIAGAVAPAAAVSVDEQKRRCRMELDSLKNPKREEGPECKLLRAMLGMPEPPVINNYYGDRRHRQEKSGPTTRFDQYGNPYTDFNNGAPVIDQRTGRPCTNLGGNNIRCD